MLFASWHLFTNPPPPSTLTTNDMHTTTQMNQCKAGGLNDTNCHSGLYVSFHIIIVSFTN